MTTEEMVIALSPDGKRVEILRANYGQGLHAEIPPSLVSAQHLRRCARDWQKAVLASPVAGTKDADYQRWARRRHPIDLPPAYDPESAGREIMDILLPGPLEMAFRQCLASARRSENALRLRLVLRSDPGLEILHSIPWELIHDSIGASGLARDPATPFVRSYVVAGPADRLPAEAPLRILLVFPQPHERDSLQVGRERALIVDRLSSLDAEVRFETIPSPVTLEATHVAFLRHRPHILHFGGHGSFDAEGFGCLDFAEADGSLRQVPGTVFGSSLRQADHHLSMVVLNACQSADRLALDHSPFRAVAGALIGAGHNAVVAMHGPVRDLTAVEFSAALYDRIAGGDDIDQAVNSARNRLYLLSPSSPEWSVPVLALRSADGRLLRPSGSLAPGSSTLRPEIIDRAHLVRAKTSRFVGRSFVFQALDDFLETDGGCFILEGDPGIGKTTFLAELLRRRRYLHHFNEYASGRSSRMEHALRNLCAQVIERHELPYKRLPEGADQDWSCLIRLLDEARTRQSRPCKMVLLIDALDEAEAPPMQGANTLGLPRVLPAGVFLVLSKRNDRAVRLRFDGRSRLCELRHDSPDNLEDIADFVRQALSRPCVTTYLRQQEIPGTVLRDLLLDRSDGNFMYLHHVLLEIEDGLYRNESPDDLPRGLVGYYDDHWARLRAKSGDDNWFDLELPVLAIVTMAKRPVSIGLIAGVLDRTGDESRIAATLGEWSQFLHISKSENAPGTSMFRLYHGSFHDFVRAKDEVTAERVRLKEASRNLFGFLKRSYRQFRAEA